MKVETRRFDQVEHAVVAYHRIGARLIARQREPHGPGPTCSAFLMQDADSPAGFVSVVGDDDAEVAREAGQLGGQPFELDAEHAAAMVNRRLTVGELQPAGSMVGFFYHEPGEIRPDGSMSRWE